MGIIRKDMDVVSMGAVGAIAPMVSEKILSILMKFLDLHSEFFMRTVFT